jgi:hypothetical protein
MVARSRSVEDAENDSEFKTNVSDDIVSWLDTDKIVTVSMTADITVNVAAESRFSVAVKTSVELVEIDSGIEEIDAVVKSKLEEGKSAIELERAGTDVSVTDRMVSLSIGISDETKPSSELFGATDIESTTTAADVSRAEEVTSDVMIGVVELPTRVSVVKDTISIVVLEMLLVAVEVVIVEDAEELERELEDDNAWHLPLILISAFFGTVAFCAGSVKVHSLSSLMFLTPRRESRRYALA